MNNLEDTKWRLERVRARIEALRNEIHSDAEKHEAADGIKIYASTDGEHGSRPHAGLDRLARSIEVAGGMAIDDMFLTGVLSSPMAVEWMAEAALLQLDRGAPANLMDLFFDIVGDPRKRQLLTRNGAWMRLNWHHTRLASASSTLAMHIAHTEASAWRNKKPTAAQIAAIREINRAMHLLDTEFVASPIQDRGSAYDYIRRTLQIFHHRWPDQGYK